MIEDMDNKDILDKARMEGMNQGVWLAVQELAHDGRWTQAAEELVSSCGNSGFSAPFEINLVKKLCGFDIISPLRFDDGEWGKNRLRRELPE